MKFGNKILSKFKHKTFEGDKEASCFLMSLTTWFFAIAIHFLLLLVFLFFSKHIQGEKSVYYTFFIVYNIVCILLFVGMLFIIKKRNYFFYGIFFSLAAIICSVVLSIFAGLETYGLVFLLLLVLILLQFPFASKLVRSCIVIFAMLMALGCIITCHYIEPLFVFESWLGKIIVGINIILFIIVSLATFFVLHILESTVKTIREQKLKELSSQSKTDELTGLFNRRYAKKFFKEGLKEHSKYCIAMLDIDDFKLINDTHGHSCGDEVLKFLAELLTKNLRSHDIIIRWGGEEILIVLCEISLETAHIVLEKIRNQVANSVVKVQDLELRFSVTIGVSQLEEDIEMAIKSCDQKMYFGKRNGKNVVVY